MDTTTINAHDVIHNEERVKARSQFGEIEIMTMRIFREHYQGLGWHLLGLAPSYNVFVGGKHRAFGCPAEAWLCADRLTAAGFRVLTDIGDNNPACTCGEGHAICG